MQPVALKLPCLLGVRLGGDGGSGYGRVDRLGPRLQQAWDSRIELKVC